MVGVSDYNYEHFSRDLLRKWRNPSFSGPEPGEEAPGFKATTLEGETLRLRDFRDKKNVFFVAEIAQAQGLAIQRRGFEPGRVLSRFRPRERWASPFAQKLAGKVLVVVIAYAQHRCSLLRCPLPRRWTASRHLKRSCRPGWMPDQPQPFPLQRVSLPVPDSFRRTLYCLS